MQVLFADILYLLAILDTAFSFFFWDKIYKKKEVFITGSPSTGN